MSQTAAVAAAMRAVGLTAIASCSLHIVSGPRGGGSKSGTKCESSSNKEDSQSSLRDKCARNQKEMVADILKTRRRQFQISDDKETMKKLDILRAVAQGEITRSQGIQQCRAMFGQDFETVYKKHPCGEQLRDWHDCFFNKMDENLKDSSKTDRMPTFGDCANPQLLLLSSCMLDYTERLESKMISAIGEEEYNKMDKAGKRRLIHVLKGGQKGSSKKSSLSEEEVDQLMEEDEQAWKEVKQTMEEFRRSYQADNRKNHNGEEAMFKGSDGNVDSGKKASSSWWKWKGQHGNVSK